MVAVSEAVSPEDFSRHGKLNGSSSSVGHGMGMTQHSCHHLAACLSPRDPNKPHSQSLKARAFIIQPRLLPGVPHHYWDQQLITQMVAVTPILPKMRALDMIPHLGVQRGIVPESQVIIFAWFGH